MQFSESTPPIIAVVEDDEDINANVRSFLKRSGMDAWGAESAEDFYVGLLQQKANLVIVDLGLPGETGLSLISRLTKQNVPVVVLTARGGVDSRIEAMNAGALQYFAKPTDMNVLVASVRSLLRHTSKGSTAQSIDSVPWRLDAPGRRLVAPNQEGVSLTTREFELLSCLIRAEGAMVSKQTLVESMDAGDIEGGFHRIESQLTRLRRKTLDATGLALPVRAVFGKGLVFLA